MLVSQTIELVLHRGNIKFLREKGYNIPTFIDENNNEKVDYGKIICINAYDLTKYSKVNVKVQCDYCGKIIEKQWYQYLKLKSNTYCCSECLSHKKKSRDNEGNLSFVEIPYRNKEWLYEQYIVNNRSANDIANEYKVDIKTIHNWLTEYNLHIKNDEYQSKIDKKSLNELYSVQHKSTSEIADIIKVSPKTVVNLLKRYNIPLRTISTNYKNGYIKRKSTSSNRSIEFRINISCKLRNIPIEEFNGFASTEQHLGRNNSEYKEWRTKVFERDNYTCQCCGKHGGELNAHHLYNFAQYSELKYNVDNGITICPKCHLIKYPDSFHSLYGEKNNTPEQFYEYVQMKNNKTSEIKEVI